MSDASSDMVLDEAPFGRLPAQAQQGDVIMMRRCDGGAATLIAEHMLLWEPHAQVIAVTVEGRGPAVLKLADKGDGASQLATEREILALLADADAPGVPRIVAAGSVGAAEALVLQPLGLCSAQTLLEQSADGRVDAPTVCAIAEQVLQILPHIWKQGVCVVDIAPSNIIQLADGSFQLIDFGSAYSRDWPLPANPIQHRIFCPLRSCNRNCNPSAVKPPFSPAYDLNSLVFSLVFLATGSLPWLEMDEMSMRLSKIQCRRNPRFLCPGLPPIFEQFIRWVFTLPMNKWDVPADIGEWATRFGRFAAGTAV